MTTGPGIEDLLRASAPQVLAALMRQYGDFDAAEDAVQEALLSAAVQWPDGGIPSSPVGWLVTVASRRLVDQLRSDIARRRREVEAAGADASTVEFDDLQYRDDTLTLLLLCCHPSLTPSSQIALTLRAVGGLTTAEIARAFLVPESTMAQRISRAKQSIRASGAGFGLPTAAARDAALGSVLHVLYLIFTEGYAATSGPRLYRGDLAAEAIRLARLTYRLLPDDGEVGGLLALMLLTDARRSAREGPDGSLVPLAEQDRGRWDRTLIDEGIALVTRTLARSRVGPYQVQAAIAAVHAEASIADETDWRQIDALYTLLEHLNPSPVIAINHAVAIGMLRGPRAGLTALEPLDRDQRVRRNHRLHAVRAHLLEVAGDHDAAQAGYRRAARLTSSIPEQRYLLDRAARLAGSGDVENGRPAPTSA